MAREEFPEIRFKRGFEVMLDVPNADLSDPRLTLGGTRFVLVEFPSMILAPNSAQALLNIMVEGHGIRL